MSELQVEERRKAILAAAIRRFDASGYSATTMDEVAAEAGISKGSIYNYFHSKEDLFAQLFGAMASQKQDEIEAAMAQAGAPSKQILCLVDQWAAHLPERQRFGRLFLEFWATAARGKQGHLAKTFSQFYNRWRDLVAATITQGIQEGEFRKDFSPSTAATLILAILDGISVQLMTDMGINVDAEFVEALKRAIMAGLTVTPPAIANCQLPIADCHHAGLPADAGESTRTTN